MSEHAGLLKRIRAGHEVAGEIIGNWELQAPIASGGQAVVAEARHRGLGHRVALKLLDPGAPASDPDRFRQEGQLLSRLSHPSLPRVLDLGEDDGLHYLALELIEGPTFEEFLDEGVPDPLWSAERIAEVADALEYCHQAGLVHRDVKPQNVIVGERAVLCDFGLARRDLTASRFESVDALARSNPEEIKGSPEFMAPEQADPEAYGPATPAADVHGLGATLYYLLTGDPPFTGDTTQSALDAVLAVVPPAPSTVEERVPPWLDALCLAALAKDPDHRPASAAAFALALRA
ncbi:MAG: serine/threonine protein kinase, partial [Planctomycetes bacterium]|nr:serine/threonine protein kinase [Planctomycetota bacterium]